MLRWFAREFFCTGCGRSGIYYRCARRLVVYFGLKIAVKPPDADHPYGHGKAEPIAALVVSLALMAAALAIIYEGIREIIAPHPAPAPYTLVVLAGVLIIKGLLFRRVQSVGSSYLSIQPVSIRDP